MSQPVTTTKSWNDYFKATLNNPPHPMVVKALDAFERTGRPTGHGLDLGCGAGRDTRELLRRGWNVLAIDREPAALYMLRGTVSDDGQTRLTTRVSSFETLKLMERVDLVNASYSLPFCQPDHFYELWAEIVMAIRPGGRFSGNFFGIRDAWAGTPTMTFFDSPKVHALLAPFDVEFFEEVDRQGTTALEGNKHWHVFNVVARKR
ncbi:MAG: class I SAM-dependent methyltransferase [Anaerolineae bacterium]